MIKKRFAAIALASALALTGLAACDAEDVRDAQEGVDAVEDEVQENVDKVEKEIDKADTDGQDD